MSGLANLGSVVDTDGLLRVVWTSLVAGIGVTAVFGVALLGAIRAVDLSREGHRSEAAVFWVVGAAALLVVGAAIVFGIVVMVQK